MQTTAAYSPWQKGRVEQRIATIKEVAVRSAMSVVSYEVAHALRQRAGRLGLSPPHPPLLPSPLHPATRVFGQRMKVHGKQMEDGEVVLHPKVVDEGDELTRRFIIRASAQEALEKHAASAAIRRPSVCVVVCW